MVMNMESWNFGEITNNDIYIYIDRQKSNRYIKEPKKATPSM